MMRWPLTVTYRDGTAAEVVADQYAVGVYARWAVKSGYPVADLANTSNAIELVTPLRVMAWAEVQRDAKTKASFDAWDATVAEVEGGKIDAVDPTQTATSGG